MGILSQEFKMWKEQKKLDNQLNRILYNAYLREERIKEQKRKNPKVSLYDNRSFMVKPLPSNTKMELARIIMSNDKEATTSEIWRVYSINKNVCRRSVKRALDEMTRKGILRSQSNGRSTIYSIMNEEWVRTNDSDWKK